MMKNREHRIRSGFTLVELLIGIAVLGILVGMLSYALIPAFNSAREYTIYQEMVQIEQSIEQFKTKYGFYPPSFVGIAGPDDLLPYINRIAPNHQEALGAVGSRPIDLWWDTIGQYIEFDHGDDLVFWLSGLAKNQQFPLTNGATVAADMPAAFDDGNINRDIFYEFNSGQIERDAAGALVDRIAHYKQPAGKDAEYLYIDNDSYGIDVAYDGYQNDGGLYENPDTFQLITFGMDGLRGNPGAWRLAGSAGEDNICNFAQGRLDKLINGAIETTAN